MAFKLSSDRRQPKSKVDGGEGTSAERLCFYLKMKQKIIEFDFHIHL